MPNAAELIVILGAFAFIVGIAVKRVPQRKALAFIGVVLIVGGTLVGGLAWAGIPGVWSFQQEEPPVAGSLFTVTFLSTSDTDRTEVGENINSDGDILTYELVDAQMDGLGDVNLDIRVTNANAGEMTDTWGFVAEITSVSTTGVPSASILNLTDINTRWAVTWSMTDVGAPTLSQVGDKAYSYDWTTGASDQLNVDLEMSPSACDDLSTGSPGTIIFLVGGVSLTLQLMESV